MSSHNLEQEIIGLYSGDVSSLYSINQIATRLDKAYPYINKKVKIFIKNNIFRKIVVGRSHLCSLNLENDETIYLLIYNEILKKKEFQSNKKNSELIEYISRAATATKAVLVLKAKNNIIFVTEEMEDSKSIQDGLFKSLIHDHKHTVVNTEEFLRIILNDKSIQEDHIILKGYEKYYDLVRSIEDDLRIKYSKLLPRGD